MDSPLEKTDLTQFTDSALEDRESKVSLDDFRPLAAPGASVTGLIRSFPDVLAARSLRRLIEVILAARRDRRQIMWAIGAHPIKCGLGRLIADLIERGFITALAMNGAAAIHDFELAKAGKTSEDVARNLPRGRFGTARDAATFCARAAELADEEGGFGRAMGSIILSDDLPNKSLSPLAAAVRRNIPVTVHVAIGTDFVHMHPVTDGAKLGRATYEDFKIFCAAVGRLAEGVYVNVGSAVVLPEVFMKAVAVASNAGKSLDGLVTANLDMVQHYRPTENVIRRPPGEGLAICGHHEIMLPLLRAALVSEDPEGAAE